MTDQTLTCRDCGQAFTFTAGEQAFFTSRGFSTPGRCADCRAQRKQERGGGGGGRSYGSSYGDDSYGGGGGGGGGYDRPARQMFTATCSSCGQEAHVPFEPSGEKPVYCSDCFSQRGGATRTSYTGNQGNRGGGGGGSRW